MSGANWFAYACILAWPIVALAFYKLRSLSEATAWTVLGALLFLPSHVGIKFEMIPAIDKTLVGNVSALLGCLIFGRQVIRTPPAAGPIVLLTVLYIVSPVITSTLNNDTITIGGRVLPGVGVYDGISALINQTILFVPFFLGRRFLANPQNVETLLRVLVAAGLLYSLPMLFEIRMSPQLSSWIYGTFSSTYAVEMRYGGFRPVVFMINGLAAASFLATALIAAAGLWRAGKQVFVLPPSASMAYLTAVLVLCKSAGALVYGLAIGMAARWFSSKLQMRLAILLAVIAITYPVLRLNGYFPTQTLVQFASSLSKDRADSLNVRFSQEDLLLDRAALRLWFGWGRYGRERLYDQSGNDTTITDGQWIITVGQFGIIGFLAQFGLLTLPIFGAWRASSRSLTSREKSLLAALALIAAICAVEQLPNANVSPWNWLVAGALYGISERIRLRQKMGSMSGSPRRQAERISSGVPAANVNFIATSIDIKCLASPRPI